LSAVTLEQLQAAEAKLIRALGDPTRTVFFDEFKRENRPVSELQSALASIRSEIAKLTPAAPDAAPRPARYLHRGRSAF